MNNERFVGIFNKIIEVTNTDRMTLEQLALKTSEETGELAQSVLSYTNASGVGHKCLGKDDVVEESMDVLICALSVAIRTFAQNNEPVSLDTLLDIVETKTDKWISNIKNDKV